MASENSRRVRRSRAWIRAYWQAHVSAQASSGLTGAGYCREHGLRSKSFYRWRRVLGESGELGELLGGVDPQPVDCVRGGSKPLFAEVRIPADGISPGASGVEVALRSGVVVRVSRGFDAATLRQVVSVLEAGAC